MGFAILNLNEFALYCNHYLNNIESQITPVNTSFSNSRMKAYDDIIYSLPIATHQSICTMKNSFAAFFNFLNPDKRIFKYS